MIKDRIFLCTDLDRTLIPNGLQHESPGARALFRDFSSLPGVTLAYVSGRNLGLQLDAIRDYELPAPDYAIGDVGTSIFRFRDGDYQPWTAWDSEIATDWRGKTGGGILELVGVPPSLRLQEADRQNTYKLSYYAAARPRPDQAIEFIDHALKRHNIEAGLIWSVDETRGLGLLDIIPARATKLHAIEFLIERLGFERQRCVFAGDSGNDLPVLCSGIPSVLVHNAEDAVRFEALAAAGRHGNTGSLYLARGGFLGMNGNYAAGILEGLAHFLPETGDWLESHRMDHQQK